MTTHSKISKFDFFPENLFDLGRKTFTWDFTSIQRRNIPSFIKIFEVGSQTEFLLGNLIWNTSILMTPNNCILCCFNLFLCVTTKICSLNNSNNYRSYTILTMLLKPHNYFFRQILKNNIKEKNIFEDSVFHISSVLLLTYNHLYLLC